MNEHQKAKRQAKTLRRAEERKLAKIQREDYADHVAAEHAKSQDKQGGAIPLRSEVRKKRRAIGKARERAELRGSEIDKLRTRFYPEYKYFIELHRQQTKGFCEHVGVNNLSADNWGGLNCYDCKKLVATLEMIKKAQRELIVEKADIAAEEEALKAEGVEFAELGSTKIGLGLVEMGNGLVAVCGELDAENLAKLKSLIDRQKSDANYLDQTEALGDLERPDGSKEIA